MRSLSTILEFLAQCLIVLFQSLYLRFKYCYLLVPIIANKLKILYSIICFNVILVVNYFPTVKTSPQMFCHNKAMFKYIALFISHWVKEIFRVNFKGNIATPRSCSPTLPIIAIAPPMQIGKPSFLLWGKDSVFVLTGTMTTSKVSRQAFAILNPPLLATINASVPNTCARMNTMFSYLA